MNFFQPENGRKKGITIVEVVIYGGFIFGVCFSIYQGVLFFQEWQCRKNMAALNEAIELQMTQAGSNVKTLDDVKGSLKTSVKTTPRCPSVPAKYNYLFNPDERRVRCTYHGVL